MVVGAGVELAEAELGVVAEEDAGRVLQGAGVEHAGHLTLQG